MHASSGGRRCEFVFDQRTYVLFNRGREITLVNDYPVTGSVALHPGDWIRMGYDGPLVRFLGQARSRSDAVDSVKKSRSRSHLPGGTLTRS